MKTICKMPVIAGFECKDEATKLCTWDWFDGKSRTEPVCDHHASMAPFTSRAHITLKPL